MHAQCISPSWADAHAFPRNTSHHPRAKVCAISSNRNLDSHSQRACNLFSGRMYTTPYSLAPPSVRERKSSDPVSKGPD